MTAQSVAPLLLVKKLTRTFGGVQALRGVDLAVAPGSIVGVIGPNGSGKTTLFQCLSGVDQGATGAVFFAGEPILGLKPHSIYRRGLARTFQLSRLFPQLTVLENLLVAAHRGDRKATDHACELLTQVKLQNYCDVLGADLSYGQQKLIEFLQVLMGKPQLILLDEPAAGVNPTLRIVLWEMIRRLHGMGITFIIIEHNMDVIADLCEHVIVLADGEVIARGTFQAIRDDEAVLTAYFGSTQ